MTDEASAPNRPAQTDDETQEARANLGAIKVGPGRYSLPALMGAVNVLGFQDSPEGLTAAVPTKRPRKPSSPGVPRQLKPKPEPKPEPEPEPEPSRKRKETATPNDNYMSKLLENPKIGLIHSQEKVLKRLPTKKILTGRWTTIASIFEAAKAREAFYKALSKSIECMPCGGKKMQGRPEKIMVVVQVCPYASSRTWVLVAKFMCAEH